MKPKVIIIGTIVAIVVVAAIVLVTKSGKTSNEQAASTSSSTSASTAAATITYGSNGFSPGTVTLKSGQTLAITNSSNQEIQMDSDPHPTHTDNPELNVGSIAAGQTKTVTLTKVGNWGYHNHLDPSQTGRIVVQ